MKQSTLIYHLTAFLVVAIWGSTFVCTKILLVNGLTAAQIFTLRFIIAYVLLLAFSLTRRSFRCWADTWRDELIMAALGLTGGTLYFLTENSAMNYTTTTNTSLIVCCCPLFASLLIGWFYRSERMRPVQVAGTLMAVLGVTAVVLNGRFVLHLSPMGDALALGANLCWAVYSLLMIPANKRYDAVFITRKVFFYGLLFMIPYFLLFPETPALSVLRRGDILLNLFFLGQHRLDGLLPGLDVGDAQARRHRGHQLCLPESARNDSLRLVDSQRADHRLVPRGHRPHPRWNVSGRQEEIAFSESFFY